MGEQNRRVVDGERALGEAAPRRPPRPKTEAPEGPDGARALSVAADERQTERQAPAGASPGESAEGDSIG